MAERTVAVSSGARLGSTARAFDAVAAGYHRSNVENPILEHMRARVMGALRSRVASGARLLDLGCGPGTDHAALVDAGYVVTAIDASEQMVRAATERAVASGVDSVVTVHQLPIEEVGRLGADRFDAVLSNFGPLNCVADLREAARQIRVVLRPGGALVASIIGRVCPWEVAMYLARGDVSRAMVRWQRDTVAVPLNGNTVWMNYLTPRAFIRTFRAAGFERRHLEALGVVSPPPYLAPSGARHPAVLRALLAADAVVGRWPLVRSAGDHFLVVLTRV